jgi:hypothetical protein
MAHYGGGGGGLLQLLCCCLLLNALTRPRQPQLVYVQQTAGVASGELPLVACATIQRDDEPTERV